MVVEINKNSALLYQCEECGFMYKEKEWAEKCQAWCKEYNSCNLEIIQHGQSSANVSNDLTMTP